MGIVLEGFMVEAMGGDHVPHPIRDIATMLWVGGSEPYGLQQIAGPNGQGLTSAQVGLEVRGQCGLGEQRLSLSHGGYEPKTFKSSV